MTEVHAAAGASRAARDQLLLCRDDYRAAGSQFSWPETDEFNWALDWIDVIAAEHRTGMRCAWSRGRRVPGEDSPGLKA
jgi:hypothetical protein